MKKQFNLFLEILKGAGIIFCFAAFLSFTSKSDNEVESYYIFSDKWDHGLPTGFMGEKNGKSLKLDDACKVNPYKGETCVKLAVDNSESWRGIHIQFTGAWNISLDDKTPLADLSNYDKLEFYARAEAKDNGVYIIPEIGVGGGGGNEDKRNDSYLEVGPHWSKHSISLKGTELKRINTLLYMTLPEGTLYLDEIRFIKKKK